VRALCIYAKAVKQLIIHTKALNFDDNTLCAKHALVRRSGVFPPGFKISESTSAIYPHLNQGTSQNTEQTHGHTNGMKMLTMLMSRVTSLDV